MEEAYNLVKTVVIMMNFSGGGNEGNWVLRILAQKPCHLITVLLVVTTTHTMLRSTLIT